MNTEQAILETVRTLPPDKQQEVLHFAEFLQQKTEVKKPRRSLMGLCADLKQQVTEEDIAEARKEMWETFPREDF
jgi:hypothetical protein